MSYDIISKQLQTAYLKINKQNFLIRNNKGCQSSLECQMFYLIFFANFQISQSDHHNFDHPKMPRISKRASLLKEYEAVAKFQVEKAYIRFALMKRTALKIELMII